MFPSIATRETNRVSFRSFIPFPMISFAPAWDVRGLCIFLPEEMAAGFCQLTGNRQIWRTSKPRAAITRSRKPFSKPSRKKCGSKNAANRWAPPKPSASCKKSSSAPSATNRGSS